MEEGNLISVLIKPNLFWMATETAPCHYADLGRGEGPLYPLVETIVGKAKKKEAGKIFKLSRSLQALKCTVDINQRNTDSI